RRLSTDDIDSHRNYGSARRSVAARPSIRGPLHRDEPCEDLTAVSKRGSRTAPTFDALDASFDGGNVGRSTTTALMTDGLLAHARICVRAHGIAEQFR